jgi:hypothetical protein
MRRTLLLVGVLLASSFGSARAASCVFGPTTGIWNLAGNWGCGHVPLNTDTCVIGPGQTAVVEHSGDTCGVDAASGTAIGGTVVVDSTGASALDANGMVQFTLKSSAAANAAVVMPGTGHWIMRKGAFLKLDTTTGPITMDQASGFDLDWQGDVTPTSIAGMTGPTANAGLCGANGSVYVINPKSGIEHAQLGRPIYFTSGQWHARQAEIVKLDTTVSAACPSGQCFEVCDNLTDSAALGTCGAGAVTCGERFVGHQVVGNFIVAGGGTGIRHSVPIPIATEAAAAALCTAAGLPYPWCTGAGTKTITSFVFPAVGDTISIVQDVWVGQIGGTGGYVVSGIPVNTAPKVRAINAFGGGIGAGPTFLFGATTLSSLAGRDIEYLNVHDGGGPFEIHGYRDYNIRNNVIHDQISTGAFNGGGVQLSNNGSINFSPRNITISDNHMYRVVSNGIEVGASNDTIQSLNIKILRNLIHDGCTATAASGEECAGIEANAMPFGEIAYNVIYDLANKAGAREGDGIRGSSAGADNGVSDSHLSDGLAVHHNFVVNMDRLPFNCNGGANCRGVVFTANYAANARETLTKSGRHYGNIYRNGGLLNANSGAPLMLDPIVAVGNILIGNDDIQAAGAGCNVGCMGEVMEIRGVVTNTAAAGFLPVIIHDNLLHGSFNGPMVEFPFNSDAGPTSITLEHNTPWGRGIGGHVGFNIADWAPTGTITATINDTLATDTAGTNWIVCTADTDMQENLGNFYLFSSPLTAQNTGPTGANCNTAGLQTSAATIPPYRDRFNYDWNIVTGHPARTAGASPAGSSMGIRAFNFPLDAINDPWGDGLPFYDSAGGLGRPPFPKPISNATGSTTVIDNRDTDGDGVLDLYDNCIRNWNPNQWDADGDGIGDVCE